MPPKVVTCVIKLPKSSTGLESLKFAHQIFSILLDNPQLPWIQRGNNLRYPLREEIAPAPNAPDRTRETVVGLSIVRTNGLIHQGSKTDESFSGPAGPIARSLEKIRHNPSVFFTAAGKI